MNYLEWLEFEDAMDRFKWYPKSFCLLIFCKNMETVNLFCKAIDEQNIKWDETLLCKDQIIYKKDPYQKIEISILPQGPFCGRRTNAVFIDTSVSTAELNEIFLPLVNVHPIQGLYLYDEWSLRKMFELKGRHTACDTWEKDMHGLDKEK